MSGCATDATGKIAMGLEFFEVTEGSYGWHMLAVTNGGYFLRV
jgi:hypothetical protein